MGVHNVSMSAVFSIKTEKEVNKGGGGSGAGVGARDSILAGDLRWWLTLAEP